MTTKIEKVNVSSINTVQPWYLVNANASFRDMHILLRLYLHCKASLNPLSFLLKIYRALEVNPAFVHRVSSNNSCV